MGPEQAERAAIGVGVITLVLGGALVVAPEKVGPMLMLGDDPAVARAVGISDLVLVPGLLRGPRRAKWMIARAVLNQAIGTRYRSIGASAGSNLMHALTVADSAIAARLIAAGR